MASTPTTKRGVVDFLWEWTQEKGAWSRLLIKQITSNERQLTPAERKEIFSYFLLALGFSIKLPELKSDKPVYSPTTTDLRLQSLSEIAGVNRLAPAQTINFSKNLTIVYGENGTGKTGYSRILKSLGFSYDPQVEILPDIFVKKQPQSAKIAYLVDGISKEYTWNPTQTNPDLRNLSVFNSKCVDISLSDRQLIVTPSGFRLFNLVTTELGELSKLLAAELEKYPTTILWKDKLHNGTPQLAFIDKLSDKSSTTDLDVLSKFDAEEDSLLKAAESELGNLNKALLEKRVEELQLFVSEVAKIGKKVEAASLLLTPELWQKIIMLNALIAELAARTKLGIKDLAEQNGVRFYETDQFQTFLKSAEEYIKILGVTEYPTASETCVYCLQPLESNALALLSSYRQLLNDTTEAELEEAKEQRETALAGLSAVETNLRFHLPVFGVDTENTPIQPAEIFQYNSSLTRALTDVASSKLDPQSNLDVDFTTCLAFVGKLESALTKTLEEVRELLRDIGRRETELRQQIAELQDRRQFSLKKADVPKAIENFKITRVLNGGTSDFNTGAISRKTTAARDELVKANFEELFESEVRAFRKSNLKIEFNFGTDRGSSKVAHRINSHALSDILSEGEQKAIALAEFLTELQLDNNLATVVFDDPVNSLDHHIVDDVARRLLTLSAVRQVVVFTHSVLLFNSLLYFKDQPTYGAIDTKFLNSTTSFGKTGYIGDAEEEIGSVTFYVKKINTLLNNSPKERTEADIASEGYGYLRSAIELCVERDIFQGTVKRYQKNVALTLFLKVDGLKLDEHKGKLNEVFERCCSYLIGHSSPEPVQTQPTVFELKTDFAEFTRIRDLFLKAAKA